MLLAAFQKAFDAPTVQQIYLATVDQMQAVRQREPVPDPDLEAQMCALEARLTALSLAILERAMRAASPALAHALGPYTQRWLMAILAVDAFGDTRPADAWQQRLYRCLPDLPVARMPDGSYRGLEAMDANRGHFLQLRDLLRALRPMKPRGRPKKQASQPKTAKRSRIDPEMADQAYQLSADGAHWRDIARHLLPAYDLRDPKRKEQARLRIDRLIYAGRRRARAADGQKQPASKKVVR
jgi:hypothetical protein